MIKLFTHTDLDGVGPMLLLSIIAENIDVEYLDYNLNMEDRLYEFFTTNDNLKYYKIFIVDLNVKSELVLNKINEHYDKYKNVLYFDHHEMKDLDISKYDKWLHCEVNKEDPKCGSQLFLNYFKENRDEFAVYPYRYIGPNILHNLEYIYNLINEYDTWLWVKLKHINPKKLNDIFNMYGREIFIKYVLDKVFQVDFLFNYYFDGNCEKYNQLLFGEKEEALLQNEDNKMQTYFKNKDENKVWFNYRNFTICSIFCEQYHSQLGEYILSKNDSIDILIMYNTNTKSISLRTKKDIDLTNIAKELGGGGHKQACGAPLVEFNEICIDILNAKIKSILENLREI